MRSLVHISGGYDTAASAVLELERGRNVLGLYVKHGARYEKQETKAARYVADRLGIPMLEAEVRGVQLVIDDVLVPARGLYIMGLSYAACAVYGCDCIVAGAGTPASYVDNQPQFYKGLADVAAPLMEQAGGKVSVRLPVIDKDKREVLDILRRAGIDLKRLWNCYHPTTTGERCGSCFHCKQMEEICTT